ncbi:MAG: ABC transporter permease [Nocardioidaceae bacterium]
MTTTSAPPVGTPEPAPVTTNGRSPHGWAREVLTAVLAVVLALFVGALIICVADPTVRSTATYFFAGPGDFFSAAWNAVGPAYGWLFRGAILDPATLSSGSISEILGSISETLVYAGPVTLAGLSVAMAFRAGLFNIGAQGQVIVGAAVAGWLGFSLDLPWPLQVPIVLVGGMLGGAAWGGIAGVLKARTGAHEVITTIMLNYLAVNLLAYLLTLHWFQAPPFIEAQSRAVHPSTKYPSLFPFADGLRANIGVLVVLLLAALVWVILERTSLGFRLKAIGSNPAAAVTAGMSVGGGYVAAMLIAGALAGAAGAAQVMGPSDRVLTGIDNGVGFDGITVALLGRGKPAGVLAAGLLFGALRAGGQRMASQTGTPVDLVTIVQALTVLFIAAPALIRTIFRVRATDGGLAQTSAKGW